jgi:hypothetical protein
VRARIKAGTWQTKEQRTEDGAGEAARRHEIYKDTYIRMCVTVTRRVYKAVATTIWGSGMRSSVSRSGDVKRAGNETESVYYSNRRARQWSTW